MEERRPNPQQVLHAIREQDDQESHGKLKIFFGYAAGVGKTYAMLQAAHQARKNGVDVAVGYVERHTRPDTLALLDGLEDVIGDRTGINTMTAENPVAVVALGAGQYVEIMNEFEKR